ncbi:chromosome segregation protein SMC [Bacillus cereus]|uniref:chromosome segregation protein SMC n=1 Tax=Bacillus cereus TaxID=1396 RepID=UPI000BEDC9A2|nr:chromosome segregation protein SMC [Bacillus cereus]PEB35723.1 chromosome segregation protein SMC [Bacillus cereus]
MTENEKKLIQQIYEKVNSMDNRVIKLEGKMDKLGDRVTSIEKKMDDLKNVHIGLQATFENGFSDVRKELDEIKQINKNKRSVKEIVESIAGKE